MKKALIVTALTGFIRAFLLYDINVLKNLGYEVHCAANGIGDSETIGYNKDYYESMGVIFHHIDFSSNNPLSKNTLLSYKQIKSVLKTHNFDIITIHTPIPGVLTRLAARKNRKTGSKVLYTTHGFYFHDKSNLKSKLIYRTIESIMSKFTDILITINKEDYRAACKMFCKDVKMINGVGVDTSKFCLPNFSREEYRRNLGIGENEIILLSIGELSYRKNYQVVIRALAELKNPQIKYLICGKGLIGNGIQEELEKLANEKQVSVVFMGYRQDIPQVIAASDIGVIPSNREGLGLAGIEMLAGGLPVIGSDVQGIKDYIINGRTGFLADPGKPQEFAEAIFKLLDLKQREKMKEDCIAMAKKFDSSVSHKQILEIYKSLM